MTFIAANTTIRAPKVYNTHFIGTKRDKSHIVMDYMPGESPEKVWKSLTKEQKEAACVQLGGCVDQLQPLTGSSKRVETGNGKSVNIILRSRPRRNGRPFDTVCKFSDWLIEGVIQSQTPPRFRDTCRAALSGCQETCFVQGDLTPRNILVDETGHVTAILG
jgi:aminoglycoside phosphotransferase (APT) family kinase protein